MEFRDSGIEGFRDLGIEGILPVESLRVERSLLFIDFIL
jgi:hypothetical protein